MPHRFVIANVKEWDEFTFQQPFVSINYAWPDMHFTGYTIHD